MQQMNQYKCFLQNTEIFYLFRNRSHNIARWTISIKPKDDKKNWKEQIHYKEFISAALWAIHNTP